MEHLLQCIRTLELSLQRLENTDPKSIDYEVFRNAVIKGFEVTLETSGKLLRKKLKSYSASPNVVDRLTYKEIFREAAKHQLLSTEAVTRWFAYRDNRNDTAHDYGVHFATETLVLLTTFLKDAKTLAQVLQG